MSGATQSGALGLYCLDGAFDEELVVDGAVDVQLRSLDMDSEVSSTWRRIPGLEDCSIGRLW